MNQKEYELIAEEIRLDYLKYTNHNEPDKAQAIWEIAHRLKAVFVQNYPSFDRAKFLKACGIEE